MKLLYQYRESRSGQTIEHQPLWEHRLKQSRTTENSEIPKQITSNYTTPLEICRILGPYSHISYHFLYKTHWYSTQPQKKKKTAETTHLLHLAPTFPRLHPSFADHMFYAKPLEGPPYEEITRFHVFCCSHDFGGGGRLGGDKRGRSWGSKKGYCLKKTG